MSPTPKYCHLLDEIKLIHSVYFLQGVPMQRFLGGVFDMIDDPSSSIFNFKNKINSINSNFHEHMSELLETSFRNLDKE